MTDQTSLLYSVEALSTGGGRDGHARTSDGAFSADMRAPKALGGSGDGLNPEQLFAAGYAACFYSALLGAARAARIAIPDKSVGARVELHRSTDGIDLAVHLEVVIPGLEATEAQALAKTAHEHCPYSRATRGNILVTVEVSDE